MTYTNIPMNDCLLEGPSPVKPQFGCLDSISLLLPRAFGSKAAAVCNWICPRMELLQRYPATPYTSLVKAQGKSGKFFRIIKYQNCNLDHLDSLFSALASRVLDWSIFAVNLPATPAYEADTSTSTPLFLNGTVVKFTFQVNIVLMYD